MYHFRPNLLIGYHGCDVSTANSLVNSPDTIIKSNKPFDWLGHGMYFWENNEERAWLWALEKLARQKRRVKDAAVVGAVIQLGYCCDLMDSRYLHTLKFYYSLFDTTRGVFIEGDRIYEGAEIFEKTHVQICVRNPNCIKGFFLPRKKAHFLPA